MKNFDLTAKELKAATLFVASCLDGMGGKRPSDLENDEFTWIGADVLINSGFTLHEAGGLMSSLEAKGFIQEYNGKDWIVTTSGWRWLDTMWDAIQAECQTQAAFTGTQVDG